MFGKGSSGNAGASIGSFLSSNAGELILVMGVFALGGAMYSLGQEQGRCVANKILRRHDRDVRRLEKKTEKYLKREEKKQRDERRDCEIWFKVDET